MNRAWPRASTQQHHLNAGLRLRANAERVNRNTAIAGCVNKLIEMLTIIQALISAHCMEVTDQAEAKQ